MASRTMIVGFKLLGVLRILKLNAEIELLLKLLYILTWSCAHDYSISHIWGDAGAGEVIRFRELFTHGVLVTWHTGHTRTVLCMNSVVS